MRQFGLIGILFFRIKTNKMSKISQVNLRTNFKKGEKFGGKNRTCVGDEISPKTKFQKIVLIIMYYA